MAAANRASRGTRIRTSAGQARGTRPEASSHCSGAEGRRSLPDSRPTRAERHGRSAVAGRRRHWVPGAGGTLLFGRTLPRPAVCREGAGRCPARHAVAVLRNEPVGVVGDPAKGRQGEQCPGDGPPLARPQQKFGDSLTAAVHSAGRRDPQELGLGSLLGDVKGAQIRELPRSDGAGGSQVALEERHRGRAEGTVAVINKYSPGPHDSIVPWPGTMSRQADCRSTMNPASRGHGVSARCGPQPHDSTPSAARPDSVGLSFARRQDGRCLAAHPGRPGSAVSRRLDARPPIRARPRPTKASAPQSRCRREPTCHQRHDRRAGRRGLSAPSPGRPRAAVLGLCTQRNQAEYLVSASETAHPLVAGPHIATAGPPYRYAPRGGAGARTHPSKVWNARASRPSRSSRHAAQVCRDAGRTGILGMRRAGCRSTLVLELPVDRPAGGWEGGGDVREAEHLSGVTRARGG